MLRTCEIYADEHKILFNAKKSQLLHFTKSSTSKCLNVLMCRNQNLCCFICLRK